MTSTKVCHALILRYRHPENASAWLCQVLGFTLSHEERDDGGNFRYAQLRFGNALVMIGRVGDAGFDELMAQPDEVGGAVTNVSYFVVDDIEQHYAKAVAAGTSIAIELCEYDGGGRGYTCKDPEGHAWSFGSYSPWISIEAAPLAPGPSPSRFRFSTVSTIVLMGALSVASGGSWLVAKDLIGEIQGSNSSGAVVELTNPSRAADETAALVDALTDSVSREVAARSTLRLAEERLEALAKQLATAAATIQARDEAAASLRQKIDAANAASAENDARAARAEDRLGQERRLRAMAQKDNDAGRAALDLQQKEHRASHEAALLQYNALAAKLSTTEQAHQSALRAYEELAREKASAGAKPTTDEHVATRVRAQPEVRGTAEKRDAKPATGRSASVVEPRLDRARRRCAEVRRNPGDYEPELVQLCRTL